MSQKNFLSAVIIAKNEALRIPSCLEALAFCDEILVVDNGSSDDTVSVAQKYRARTVVFHGEDFASLRNKAMQVAKGDWILYVDADEIVSQPLAIAIRATIDTWRPGNPRSYQICRINYYLGQRWPGEERMPRLFRRNALIQWEGRLHETPKTVGPVGALDEELRHDTHRSLAEMVDKTNEWSETEAQLRLIAGHPPVSWWRILRVMATGFLHSYIELGGWRAGTVGWVESIYQSFSLFITYAKLWEKQKRNQT